MKMNKKIELIEAIRNNKMDLHFEFNADGNQELAMRYLIESAALSAVICILKDDEFAEEIAKTFFE